MGRPTKSLRAAAALLIAVCAASAYAQMERAKGSDAEVVASVRFKLNSTELSTRAKELLDEAAAKLAADSLPIEVAGHSDTSGTENFNEDLSWQRANVVVQYLVERGIPAKRLNPVGYGNTQPLNSGETKYERWLNRRVELRVPG